MAAGVALLDAAPAAAEDADVCTLVTRQTAGELLGAKVVKTTKKTSAKTGAEECTYKTKKVDKEFRKRNLKIQLELTVQPVSDELRAQVQRIPSDEGERVEGLGDEAHATKFDDVIALVGPLAVQAKLQNYEGSPTKFRTVSEGAVRAALLRLGEIPVRPTSPPSS